MVAPVVKDSIITDPRDGKIYKTVRVYGKWWMSENLRYGNRANPGEFCTDNGITEYYSRVDTISGEEIGDCYYTWKEASDYYRDPDKGICPDGWHMINASDMNYLNSLLAKIEDTYEFLGEDGVLELDFSLHGRYYWPGDQWNDVNNKGYTWLAEEMPYQRFSTWIYYNSYDTLIQRSDYHNVAWVNRWQKEWGDHTFRKIAMPVRCVKTK